MAYTVKIPLLPETTDQILTVELDGNPYVLRVLWNERFGYFSLSVSTANNEPILTNIKMVKNYSLTDKYKDSRLPFGSFYFVQEKSESPRPSYNDLAVNFFLYYHEADIVVTPTAAEMVAVVIPLGSAWDNGLSVWDTGSTLWDQ